MTGIKNEIKYGMETIKRSYEDADKIKQKASESTDLSKENIKIENILYFSWRTTVVTQYFI